jgi:class 3 adenylate cyclase
MVRSDGPGTQGLAAEARHATVLKCDIVGSTRIKKLLDLDGQLAFQHGVERFIADVATRHSARIHEFQGDGALIVFGFPQPREDAAESAVSMGLDLVNAIVMAEIVPNTRLQFRVGIASGLIAVANDESVAGLVIDLAERLRALADPDQVVISDATKRLAAGFFRYSDLGSVQLKGFEEGARAWRVVGASPVVSRFEARRLAELEGEIIGRADALARLSGAWVSARDGPGQTVCLLGEAGIGKSRLARAALDAAIQDNAATLTIDCTPSTGNTPLYPVGVLLRRFANITPASSESDKLALAQQLLARLLPDEDVRVALSYLAPLFGLEGAAIPTNLSPAEVREHMVSTVLRMVRGLAAEGPLVVLCEDLHWIDDTTANVIARVCQEIDRLRVLMIVTMRPTSEEPLLDLSKLTIVALQPLDRSTAADLVRSVAKDAALPDEIVRLIVDRCEGVPLVLEQVTLNTLETVSQHSHAAEPSEEVPAPLQLVVQSRLGRWPQFTRIVQSASVFGREFSLRLLKELMPIVAGSQIVDAIEVLAHEGLFEEAGFDVHDRGRFKHSMIREAVYNTLLGGDRQRLHSAAADILSEDYKGTPDAAPDVIAEHLRKANRFAESIRVRLAASADTAARGAYVETEGHCAAGLAIVDRVRDPEERATLKFQLLIQLGVALTGRHGYSADVVEEAYRRAHAVCGHSAEAEALYPIMRGLATVNLVRGNLAAAHDLSLQSLKLAEQSKRVEFQIDAMSVLCYTTLYFGRLKDCRAWIKRCLRLYDAAQGNRLTYPVPQDARTAAIAVLPTVEWLLGNAQAAENALRDGLAHVERLNRDFDTALLHAWVAGFRYTQRRYAETLKHASIAVRISEQHNYREWYGTGALLALLAQSALKPDAEALEQATAAYMAFAREGVGLNASYYLWALARGHAQAGDAQSARRMLEEGFARAQASQETRMHPELLILQAELESDDGTAMQLLDRALNLAEDHGAVATAARAAAAIELRSNGEVAESARAMLDMLDGRAGYPTERNWMRERLAELRRARAARVPAAQRL